MGYPNVIFCHLVPLFGLPQSEFCYVVSLYEVGCRDEGSVFAVVVIVIVN